MTDLKITLNAYAVIEHLKHWCGSVSYETINTIMIPQEKRLHFFVDPDTLDLEKKLVEGLSSLDFSQVITRLKLSYEYKEEPLDALKDLLLDIYTELQDVKANIDDEELSDLLTHMDAELVSAATIITKIMEEV